MSSLVFDGTMHKLTYFSKEDAPIGDGWYANNVVDSSIKNLRFLPNGNYAIFDKHYPYRHGNATDKSGILMDSAEGAFGSFGIIRLYPFSFNGVTHKGVGIHSGRKSKGGADHATHGCIRTTDDVMQALTYYILNDPLTWLTVQNNHDQQNRHPHHKGDSHRHHS